MFNNFFLKTRAFYEIMWKSIVEPDRPQITIWRMRIACWIPKATDTHSEYVILIHFSRQQWLYESALMLRNTYIVLFMNVTTHFFLVKVDCLDPPFLL